jgi:hypothetical protein
MVASSALDDDGLETPQRSSLQEERRQAALRRAREEQQREQAERQVRIEQELAPTTAEWAKGQLVEDERVTALTNHLLAETIAARGVEISQISHQDLARLFDDALDRAYKLVEQKHLVQKAEELTEPFRVHFPDNRGLVERAIATAESAIQTYIGRDAACEFHWDSSANPNNIPLEKLTERREEARLSMLGALAPLTDAKIIEVLTKNPVTDHDGELFLAATIGEIEANRVKAFASTTPAQETDKQQPKLEMPTGPTPEFVKTPLWEAQAGTLDRQRHQFGRYDFPPNTPPSGGASAPVRPSPDPPKPPTPARANLPLTANEILARHNNPELEARFQNEQQVRADQKKAATPEAAVQNNVPTAAAPEFDPMDAFVSPERRKKAAEAAAAARAANPSQSFGRGGGRGRG